MRDRSTCSSSSTVNVLPGVCRYRDRDRAAATAASTSPSSPQEPVPVPVDTMARAYSAVRNTFGITEDW